MRVVVLSQFDQKLAISWSHETDGDSLSSPGPVFTDSLDVGGNVRGEIEVNYQRDIVSIESNFRQVSGYQSI